MSSMRRGLWSLILAAAFLLAPRLAATLSAQAEPPKANIVITLSVTDRGGTSHFRASGDAQLKVGETRTNYLYSSANGAGSAASADQPLGSNRTGKSGTLRPQIVNGRVQIVQVQGPPPVTQFDYSWKVDIVAVSIAPDGITFDIDWKRSELKDGTMQPTAGDHRTVTLRQGEKHLLDFAACSPADGPNASVFLDARASIAEDPAFANAAFDYDLWLTHQMADGTKVTRHAVVGGRQGERVNFGFAPIPLRLDASAPADAPSPFRLDVRGAITGRLRSDGTIQLALEPTRQQRSGTDSLGQGGGIKVFNVRPDETTSVDLPAGTGLSSFKADLAAKLTNPRPGVTAEGGFIRVDTGAFFEGATTSILVTVKRQRQE